LADHIASWYASRIATTTESPALSGTIEAEACIIGGGLAGVAAALDLAERGRSVVLLERHRIGWGASGRNGGFVTPGYPRGMPGLIEKVGVTAARELYDLSRGAHRLVRERIDRYGIDCGPIVEGALRCAPADARESLAGFCKDMARDFDMKLEHWPRERLAEVLRSPRYGDAYFNPATFTIDPLALTRGLAAAAEGLGVRIFEQSSVIDLHTKGARRGVRTRLGQVWAKEIILAGGGYIGASLHHPLGMAVIPVATFVVVTEPLGDRLAGAIRVPYAISDTTAVANYYRPLADTRLLWGGRVLTWEPGKARIAARLRRDIASFYPSLAGAKIDFAWSGLMPYLRHRAPVVARLKDGLWVSTGFGGLGMALTTLAGQMIGSGITERDDRWRLLARFGLPFAGGRLGRVPAQLVYWREQMEAWLGRARAV
jgi:gamma-glutamylputrescine oxidase